MKRNRGFDVAQPQGTTVGTDLTAIKRGKHLPRTEVSEIESSRRKPSYDPNTLSVGGTSLLLQPPTPASAFGSFFSVKKAGELRMDMG